MTGGDSGIGRAVSGVCKRRADVCIIYYNEHEDARMTKSCIEAQGRRYLLFAGDVRDGSLLQMRQQRVFQIWEVWMFLVNNAGVQFPLGR